MKKFSHFSRVYEHFDLSFAYCTHYMPSPHVVRVTDKLKSNDGRIVEKSTYRLVPAVDRYKDFKLHDFSVESLLDSGALSQMSYVTLNGAGFDTSLSNVDKLLDFIDATEAGAPPVSSSAGSVTSSDSGQVTADI